MQAIKISFILVSRRHLTPQCSSPRLMYLEELHIFTSPTTRHCFYCREPVQKSMVTTVSSWIIITYWYVHKWTDFHGCPGCCTEVHHCLLSVSSDKIHPTRASHVDIASSPPDTTPCGPAHRRPGTPSRSWCPVPALAYCSGPKSASSRPNAAVAGSGSVDEADHAAPGVANAIDHTLCRP